MSGTGSAVGKQLKHRAKPYVMKRDRHTGVLYLERQRPPFVGELPYVILLLAAILFAVISCFQYIQLRTDVETRIRRTEALEREFLSLKNENILTERDIYQIPDLTLIYDIAVTELGMVPATEDHVRMFERSNSGYVYQTDNIPNIGF